MMTSVFNVPIAFDTDDDLVEDFYSENSQDSSKQDEYAESILSTKTNEESSLDTSIDEDANSNFDSGNSDNENDKISPLDDDESMIFESTTEEKIIPAEYPVDSPELEQIKNKIAKLTNETFQIRQETKNLKNIYKKVLMERLVVYWYNKTGLKRKLNFDDKLAVPKLRTAIGNEIQKLTKLLYDLDSIHSLENKFVREIKRNLTYTINDKDLVQLELFLEKINRFLQLDKELNQSLIQPKKSKTTKLYTLKSKIVDSTTNVTIILGKCDNSIKENIVNKKVEVKFDQSDERLKIMVPGFKLLEFDASHYSLNPNETTYHVTKENKIIIYVPKRNKNNIFYQNEFRNPYSYLNNNMNDGLIYF